MSISEESFDFSIAPRTFPVKINGEPYVLREASDDAKIKYLDSTRATPTFDTKGKVTGFNTSNTFSGDGILLAECLFKIVSVGNVQSEVGILLSTLRKWPSRVTDKLVAKIKEMSEMDKDVEDEKEMAKKGQGSWRERLSLCARLGKSINELMGWHGPMTARQWLVWREWQKLDWNDPDRGDWYIMELTAAVKRIFADKPREITAESQKQEFSWKVVQVEDDGTETTTTTTRQSDVEAERLRLIERDERNKQMVLGMLGVQLDKDGNQINR